MTVSCCIFAIITRYKHVLEIIGALTGISTYRRFCANKNFFNRIMVFVVDKARLFQFCTLV